MRILCRKFASMVFEGNNMSNTFNHISFSYLLIFVLIQSVNIAVGYQYEPAQDTNVIENHTCSKEIIKRFNAAIEAENDQVFIDAIENRQNIDIADPAHDGRAPLMEASERGAVRIAQLLIDAGADVNAETSLGTTVLMYAAKGGDPEIVDELINHGARITSRNKDGNTALLLASGWGNTDVVHRLLDHGAKISEANNDGVTPIMIAAGAPDSSTYFYLAEHGANAVVGAPNGTNALCFLLRSREPSIRIFNDLLRKGIDVNTSDPKNGETPLMMAIEFDDYFHDFVVPLIQAGADVNTADKDGETPLMKTTDLAWNYEAMKYLLQNGADIEAKDKYGRTALALCVQNGTMDKVRILVEAGADMEIGDTQGNTLPQIVQRYHVKGPERIKIIHYLEMLNIK